MSSHKQITTHWEYLSEDDLTDVMVESTRSSYDSYAENYSQEYEYDWEMIQRTKHDYLHGFISNLKIADTVLVVGIGTGRDIIELSQRGLICLGIDSSPEMVKEAVKNGLRAPVIVSDLRDLRLTAQSYDGILVDSALEHIPKSTISTTLQSIVQSLRIDGIALLRFRIGSGKVFLVKDEVGERYFTSYSQSEIDRLMEQFENIEVLEEKTVNHKVAVRPGFHSVLIKKSSIDSTL